MKAQKENYLYYKLMRISKTASLLSTMTILAPESEYVEHLKPLVKKLEAAILDCKEAESFYKTKGLLED